MPYHRFLSDSHVEYGSFETWFHEPQSSLYDFDEYKERGWYWWPCNPGCLPDVEEPHGPFETEGKAIADAQMRAP